MPMEHGSQLVSAIITAIKPIVSDDTVRMRFYEKVLAAFDRFGWDTQDEVRGQDPAFDRALNETRSHQTLPSNLPPPGAESPAGSAS